MAKSIGIIVFTKRDFYPLKRSDPECDRSFATSDSAGICFKVEGLLRSHWLLWQESAGVLDRDILCLGA